MYVCMYVYNIYTKFVCVCVYSGLPLKAWGTVQVLGSPRTRLSLMATLMPGSSLTSTIARVPVAFCRCSIIESTSGASHTS